MTITTEKTEQKKEQKYLEKGIFKKNVFVLLLAGDLKNYTYLKQKKPGSFFIHT